MRTIAIAACALVVCACGAAPQPPTAGAPAGDSPLHGTWQLFELLAADNSFVRPSGPAKYTMTLTADGRAAFKLDCNKGSGGWKASAPKAGRGDFTFTPIAMTRAMCPEGSLDTRIAKELEDVRSYSIDGDRLTLVLAADAGSQIWTHAAP